MKRKFLLRPIFVAAIKAENMKGKARSNRSECFIYSPASIRKLISH